MEPSSIADKDRESAAVESGWSAIAASPAFSRFRRARRRFALACLAPFALFFFALPVMTGTNQVLSGIAVGSVTWAYIWAFALFVVGWIISGVYGRCAVRLDVMAEQAWHRVSADGGGRVGDAPRLASAGDAARPLGAPSSLPEGNGEAVRAALGNDVVPRAVSPDERRDRDR